MSHVKPVSIATLFGKPDMLRDPGIRPPGSNRFAALRSRSPSVGRPPTSPAVKRPAGDDFSPAGDDFNSYGKFPRLDGNKTFANMELVEKMIDKGKKGMSKLKDDLAKLEEVSNPLKELLGGIVDSVDAIFATMENVVSTVVDGAQRPVTGKGNQTTAAQKAVVTPSVITLQPPPTAAEVKKKRFVTAVREAEKSVLVFQLDLGKVPVMNTGTIARKVTEDITARAAQVDGNGNGRPTENTITMLEDTLSMVKGMEFFGKVTKSYVNKQKEDDPANGTFCTLPVRMNFKDKAAKVRAEKVLRTSCKLQCSTPYLVKLR